VVNRRHTNNNKKNKKNNKTKRNKKGYSLGAVFDKHIKCEFQDHDVDATMKTMVREPYVHHVPMMTGGMGYDSVYNFYKNHFVGKMPDDTKVERISRTVGKDQVVDELILKFTHDREIEFMIPGIARLFRPVAYRIRLFKSRSSLKNKSNKNNYMYNNYNLIPLHYKLI
jgi:hypothetical protein